MAPDRTFFDETRRLGTELEVVADFDLTPLLEQLGSRVAVIRNSVDSGRHTLWFQHVPTEKDLDDAVRRYAVMIEALPDQVRDLWNNSFDRCLNTGVQGGLHPPSYALELSSSAMALEVRIAARHRFTVYAVNPVTLHSPDDAPSGT
jgi:hypothetical protein